MSNHESNLTKTVSTLSKKRYKNWNRADEENLLRLIEKKQKKLTEMTDQDWNEMAS